MNKPKNITKEEVVCVAVVDLLQQFYCVFFLFQIQDLVGYLRPYHVYPNVPPAGLDTLEDAFERFETKTK